MATRVQRALLCMYQELETLLDDDDDMAEMYLTRRAAAAEREARFMEERLQSNAELGMSGVWRPSVPASQSLQHMYSYLHICANLLIMCPILRQFRYSVCCRPGRGAG